MGTDYNTMQYDTRNRNNFGTIIQSVDCEASHFCKYAVNSNRSASDGSPGTVSHLKGFVEDGMQSVLFSFCLPLATLGAVRQQVGLDITVKMISVRK